MNERIADMKKLFPSTWLAAGLLLLIVLARLDDAQVRARVDQARQAAAALQA